MDVDVSSPDPPVTSIAIVGLGLIGGSIALGVRERWPQARVFGVDTDAVAAHVLGSGAIDKAFSSVAALPDVALVILAAPVRQNVDLLQQVAQRRLACTVTDVGGTKRAIVQAARALPPDVRFVGGHPLGGGERGGFAFARPDLFAGRPWILSPDGQHPDLAVDLVSRLVTGLGARPVIVDAAEHDRLMAFLSHLPQLTASALMETVGNATLSDGLRMAGRGLVDTTRLASSPADVWRDICLTNADAIGDALDCLIGRLAQVRRDLERGGTVDEVFNAAARWRADLLKERE